MHTFEILSRVRHSLYIRYTNKYDCNALVYENQELPEQIDVYILEIKYQNIKIYTYYVLLN